MAHTITNRYITGIPSKKIKGSSYPQIRYAQLMAQMTDLKSFDVHCLQIIIIRIMFENFIKTFTCLWHQISSESSESHIIHVIIYGRGRSFKKELKKKLYWRKRVEKCYVESTLSVLSVLSTISPNNFDDRLHRNGRAYDRHYRKFKWESSWIVRSIQSTIGTCMPKRIDFMWRQKTISIVNLWRN